MTSPYFDDLGRPWPSLIEGIDARLAEKNAHLARVWVRDDPRRKVTP